MRDQTVESKTHRKQPNHMSVGCLPCLLMVSAEEDMGQDGGKCLNWTTGNNKINQKKTIQET